MTNFERIKGMSVEEMAVMIADEIPHGDCYGCDMCWRMKPPYILHDSCCDAWLRWLEREVQDEAD